MITFVLGFSYKPAKWSWIFKTNPQNGHGFQTNAQNGHQFSKQTPKMVMDFQTNPQKGS